MDELTPHRDEAHAYAQRHPDERMGEMLRWALVIAFGRLLDEEQGFYLAESFADGAMDFLLYAHLVEALMRQRTLVTAILADEPVPEVGAPPVGGVPVPRARHIDAAVAFARAGEDLRARSLMSLGIATAIRVLRDDRQPGEIGPNLPAGEVDLLLHARMIGHLAARGQRVRNILAGDFTELNEFDASMAEWIADAEGGSEG